MKAQLEGWQRIFQIRNLHQPRLLNHCNIMYIKHRWPLRYNDPKRSLFQIGKCSLLYWALSSLDVCSRLVKERLSSLATGNWKLESRWTSEFEPVGAQQSPCSLANERWSTASIYTAVNARSPVPGKGFNRTCDETKNSDKHQLKKLSRGRRSGNISTLSPRFSMTMKTLGCHTFRESGELGGIDISRLNRLMIGSNVSSIHEGLMIYSW